MSSIEGFLTGLGKAKKRVTDNLSWGVKELGKSIKYVLGGGKYGENMNKKYKKMEETARKKGTWK